ncbi:50S ribosomal protein L10 [candidate division WOR-1 bacterium RIFOXYA12_FULL_43_27]|uniref:Large ribosomal subunit protein uL10 n=1 Tax=candidate division WOR-1 bacterium RIFOXYC2_FULL_46_14 TaxID=1802587 RepID=A0A1F4U5Z6_UNCSA|nr:MAG: 50S ribosomal protein L10 [candidate division WOR-1 bacterium RIFOXYA12_FULL_43_27]OGC20454.1 MAG: 50S ribosomal protein L10 [candidate division WOR-1 bacterium RIFOXYB2_FULL_46_45]OGC31809.1 MAG: 50S ribosomal protein L10 [candidate division WOR-1 bacterium RIFOXYA2_FULL_46_56]OGC40299.1 MAG: 50S ribosomal protein L10 [candidate division WOR-1 bacterium RIFOXYC2_FULL_46_14]
MPGRTVVRKEKELVVSKIKEIADKSGSIILTDYKGMSVKQMTILRRSLKASGASYKVVKNTMSNLALPKNKELLEKLTGSVAILFAAADPVEPAKELVGFIKENEKPEIIGGILNDEFLSKDAIVKLSKLPGRQELIVRLLQSMNSPKQGIVNVLAGTLKKLLYSLNAIKDKKGQEAKGGE